MGVKSALSGLLRNSVSAAARGVAGFGPGRRPLNTVGNAIYAAGSWAGPGINVSDGGSIWRSSLMGVASNIYGDLKTGWTKGGWASSGGSKIIKGAAIATAAIQAGRIVHESVRRMENGTNGEAAYLQKNPALGDNSYQQQEMLQQQKRFESSAMGLSLTMHGIRGKSLSHMAGMSDDGGHYGVYGK